MNLVVVGINHKQAPIEIRERFGMPERLKAALEALPQALVNKILHTPFTELKQVAGHADRSEFIDVMQMIYHPQAVPPTRPAPIIN